MQDLIHSHTRAKLDRHERFKPYMCRITTIGISKAEVICCFEWYAPQKFFSPYGIQTHPKAHLDILRGVRLSTLGVGPHGRNLTGHPGRRNSTIVST